MKVIYFYGKKAAPGGNKSTFLRKVCEKNQISFGEVDFLGSDNPEERLAVALEYLKSLDSKQPVVLLGSSLGAYVAINCTRQVPIAGLFLFSPAVYLDSYPDQDPTATCSSIEIVHGWRDDIVAPKNVFRFAQKHSARLHIVDDTHRLHSTMGFLGELLLHFVENLVQDQEG